MKKLKKPQTFLQNMKYIDLHLHTMYSDGMETPVQIVRAAKMKSLDMIAITDHDNLQGYYEARKEAHLLGIDLVPGVEISTYQHHLVGLNFDPYNKKFADFIQHSQDIQKGVTQQRIDVLKDYGIPISMKKVERFFPEYPIGKYNLARTMFFDKECRACLENQHDLSSFKEIFHTLLLGDGIAAHVEKQRLIEWEQAIDKIHKADGLTVFPHPSKEYKSGKEIEDMAKKIDLIEVQPAFREKCEPFVQFAKEKNLKIVYGSDYHDHIVESKMLGREENCIDERILGAVKF